MPRLRTVGLAACGNSALFRLPLTWIEDDMARARHHAQMHHFFLDLHECGLTAIDLDGIERPDLASAQDAAIRAARDVMAGEVKAGNLCLSCHISIRDAAGAVLMEVPFREAITITGI